MASSSSSSSDASPGILYACVAHATTILSEHTAPSTSTTNTTSASSLASIILPKVNHSTPEKLTFTHDRLFVHLISDSPSGPSSSSSNNNDSSDTTEPVTHTSLIYLCVSQSSLGRRIPFAFLLSLKKSFLQSHPPSSTNFQSLPAYGCASFNTTLKSMVTTYNSGPPPTDALANAKREIDTVKDIMTKNIEQVLERGERIDLLVDKTDRLGGSARDFRVRSKGLRRRMWWKNVRVMVMLGLVVVFLIYLFVGMGCGLPAWGRCVG